MTDVTDVTDVSDRWSPSSVHLSVSMIILRVYLVFVLLIGLAHRKVGRVARTNVFEEVTFRVRYWAHVKSPETS